MVIREMTTEDSLSHLAGMHLGRLACAQGAQPFVTPFYFAYENNYLYAFSTVGRRIIWMRANPLVCVETDRLVSAVEWVSLVVFGHYEELPDTQESKTNRELAYALLQQKADWWEPAYSKTIIGGKERALVPVYFRIKIDEITGRQAIPATPGNRADSNQDTSMGQL
jgi:nitroimidazol reductase NimA-like FMN-containing flavoprotein (pyridoxamine 5'-phosphate oxidase superfamily)